MCTHDFSPARLLIIGCGLSRVMNNKNCAQRCATHLPLPPGLNIPDGRRPDDEANTVRVVREHSGGGYKGEMHGLPRCGCAWLVPAHPPWKWVFRCIRPWLPRSSSTSCAEFERSDVPRDRSLATNGRRTGGAFWGEICCCCCCCWLHKGSPPGVLNCAAVRFAIPAGLCIWSKPSRSA